MDAPTCERCYGFGRLYEGPPYDVPCPRCGGSGVAPGPNRTTVAHTAPDLRACVEDTAHRRNLQALSETPCVRLEPAHK